MDDAVAAMGTETTAELLAACCRTRSCRSAPTSMPPLRAGSGEASVGSGPPATVAMAGCRSGGANWSWEAAGSLARPTLGAVTEGAPTGAERQWGHRAEQQWRGRHRICDGGAPHPRCDGGGRELQGPGALRSGAWSVARKRGGGTRVFFYISSGKRG